jgi:cytochrome c5
MPASDVASDDGAVDVDHVDGHIQCKLERSMFGELTVKNSMVSMPCCRLVLAVALGLTLAGCGEETPVSEDKPVAAHDDAQVGATRPVAVTINAARSGEAVYQSVCMACHASGLNEAPKFGDREDWTELIEEGYGILVYESIKGEGMMPPRGGDMTLTDMEMARAVAYMANAAGASFVEPLDEAGVKAMLEQAEKEIEAHEALH